MVDAKRTVRTFDATVISVVDGDTVDLFVDLDGFDVWIRRRFRLLGCNAIELRAPGGREARDNLAVMLPADAPVTVSSVRVDKYGPRYDAVITLPDGRDLVSVLAAQQWVALWNGRGAAPLPPWPRTV